MAARTVNTQTAAFVRQSANAVLAAARAGRLPDLALDETRLDAVVDFVVETTRLNYPTLDIPFHARWRHFTIGGRDLWAELDAATDWPSPDARLRAAYDLVIVSVLLDAGAGMGWRFREPVTGHEASKSEGLGLASLSMFRAGDFSADPFNPLRVDGARLLTLIPSDLERGFQVSATNPLIGLEGRAGLLNRLGAHLVETGRTADARRPSLLASHYCATTRHNGNITAPHMLEAVLAVLGPIWPARDGALPGCGDAWFHPHGLPLGDGTSAVAFHKLSQWLTYSLIEPLIWTGHSVTDIDGLTGLPEYRNGGLLIDFGVILLKNKDDLVRQHDVGSPLVIAWRALTVALLDIIANRVRDRLGMTADELPLAKVLEGGTWSAGRRIARQLRADGGPPLTIISDGTVF